MATSWDWEWWPEQTLELGRAETLVAAIYDPPAKLKEFPIGFHVSQPGPSKVEKARVRVKAGSRKI